MHLYSYWLSEMNVFIYKLYEIVKEKRKLDLLLKRFPLPLGTLDGLRYFIVALPGPSIYYFADIHKVLQVKSANFWEQENPLIFMSSKHF